VKSLGLKNLGGLDTLPGGGNLEENSRGGVNTEL
jgi:hypothetical protein